MQQAVGANKIKASVCSRRGFTLTELLVCIGVLAALMAIAVPRFIALRPARQLNGATREVLEQLSWARARAAEENNQFVVSFPTDHSLMILDDKNNNGSADAGEAMWGGDLRTDYPGVALTINPSGSNPTFTPRGTIAQIDVITITVTNSSGSRTLTVSPTGAVTIG